MADSSSILFNALCRQVRLSSEMQSVATRIVSGLGETLGTGWAAKFVGYFPLMEGDQLWPKLAVIMLTEPGIGISSAVSADQLVVVRSLADLFEKRSRSEGEFARMAVALANMKVVKDSAQAYALYCAEYAAMVAYMGPGLAGEAIAQYALFAGDRLQATDAVNSWRGYAAAGLLVEQAITPDRRIKWRVM
jgi:hypothetical protein